MLDGPDMGLQLGWMVLSRSNSSAENCVVCVKGIKEEGLL